LLSRVEDAKIALSARDRADIALTEFADGATQPLYQPS
jgi:hypothetical protein